MLIMSILGKYNLGIHQMAAEIHARLVSRKAPSVQAYARQETHLGLVPILSPSNTVKWHWQRLEATFQLLFVA